MHGQHILNKNYSQKMLEHARNYFLWGDYILCLCKPLCAKHHMRWKVQLGPGCLSSSTQPHHTELTSDQPPAMRHRSCLPAASGKIEKEKERRHSTSERAFKSIQIFGQQWGSAIRILLRILLPGSSLGGRTPRNYIG